ncbi:MAG: hypothetical protein IKZ19_05240 [Clostridia bacterium]|nr:hypothetical protein [Clostridia bacterium]
MKRQLRNTAILAASVLLVCISLLSLTACSTKPDPEKTVRDAIASVKSYDTEEMEHYWGKTFSSVAGDSTVAKKICTGLSYEVLKSEVSDEKAKVTVEISNTDMAALSNDLMNEIFPGSYGYISPEQTNAKLAQLLCRTGNERLVRTVEISLSWENGEWVITNGNSSAIYAMLGGMCSLDAVCNSENVIVPVSIELYDTGCGMN